MEIEGLIQGMTRRQAGGAAGTEIVLYGVQVRASLQRQWFSRFPGRGCLLDSFGSVRGPWKGVRGGQRDGQDETRHEREE